MDSKYITRVVLSNKAFFASLILFAANELLFHNCELVFVNSYLNDFIAPIIILTLTQLVLSIYKGKFLCLTTKQLLFFFLYISFVFEWLLPSYSSEYISDFYDILAYLGGVLIFHFFINKKFNEHRTKNCK